MMKIRKITPADYQSLMLFWKENYFVNDLDSEGHFRLFLRKNPGLSFLAEDHGVVIGTVLGSYDGRRGYIQKLVVKKSARGTGVGRRLLDEAVSRLHRLGALYIPISCEVENLGFYEKAGFRKTNQVTISRAFEE